MIIIMISSDIVEILCSLSPSFYYFLQAMKLSQEMNMEYE